MRGYRCKKILTTPIKAQDLEGIRAGDIVYLTGTLCDGPRRRARRVVHEGMASPYDFNGGAVFHAGPIVKELPEENLLVSVGPTSSIRMEADAADFIRMTGLKMMVGKGGMGPKTTKHARNTRRSTAFLLEAARYPLPAMWKKSRIASGASWACPSASG
jgi:tartrate dehydratase beta subunit/fumarate hydratase class I family protein